jgi:mannose-6-phosphate isomerase class I
MTVATKPPMQDRSAAQFRRTRQAIAPATSARAETGPYRLYPEFPLEPNSVGMGYEALAERLVEHQFVRIDGYVGILWEQFRNELDKALARQGVKAAWIATSSAEKPAEDIEALVRPFLGGDDPLFGTRFGGRLTDFFDVARMNAISPCRNASITIVYGIGAALVDGKGPVVYVDLPKNELQFRSRAGVVCNLGADLPVAPKVQYKRFYFVDWPVLNRHKVELIDHVDWFVDGQRPNEPTFIAGNVLRNALDRMCHNVFRARPWFEPGPWGGQWLKTRLAELPQDEPNYAWSFELISPENGLVFGDGNYVSEVSFDWLMYRNHRAVLGDSADRFGYDFPIRFDFLDTFHGGNLSLQCHPRPEYIQAHFGEPFTQDETYYIVDCLPRSEVYLGFQQGVDPREFRTDLERSFRTSTPVDVKKHVRTVPAQQHDLVLIPSGTVHCSGANILVLEISATPYIFTFKMYDWLRLGLDGAPRPLNIQRAFENLVFERQGEEVERQLISRPSTIIRGEDWELVHLPTHREHFYDVHRYEFDTEVAGHTNGSPHVLMLVEGSGLIVETANGMREQFHFVETFIIPAAAGSYKLINLGQQRAKVVKAFIKPMDSRGVTAR